MLHLVFTCVDIAKRYVIRESDTQTFLITAHMFTHKRSIICIYIDKSGSETSRFHDPTV